MNNSNKVIVFGAAGQLGQCLKKVIEEKQIGCFLFLDEFEGDILKRDSLRVLFEREKPAFVINCAAYTAVDKAEDEVEQCSKINRVGAANLARFCAEFEATLIHVSTDFVFEGNRPVLLNETDMTNPVNVYGQTKLEGELEIAKILKAHYILRTSWLYSEFGGNFVKTMRKLGAEREELNVIVDQVGTPTYAIDLAKAILEIIEEGKDAYGIYHYSNEGVASWYDFAKAIFDISGIGITLNPIPGAAYPTKAKRPEFSVLDKARIKNTFEITIPYWRDSLVSCISELEAQEIGLNCRD